MISPMRLAFAITLLSATGMDIYIKNAGSDIYPLRANTMLLALKYKPDQRVQCEKPHAQTIRSAFR